MGSVAALHRAVHSGMIQNSRAKQQKKPSGREKDVYRIACLSDNTSTVACASALNSRSILSAAVRVILVIALFRLIATNHHNG